MNAKTVMHVKAVDLSSFSYAELYAIACDLSHPQRDEANDLLAEIEADGIARRTFAGGEA